MGKWELNLDVIDSIQLLGDDQAWSGGTIRSAIFERQNLLAEAGIGPHSYVVVAHGNTPAFFVDLFAIWYLEACAAVVNPSLTDSELVNVAIFTGADAILPGDRAVPVGLSQNVVGITGLSQPSGESVRNLQFECDESAPALVLFTSGTTGDPKGVVHSFHSLRARLASNHEHIPADTLSRTLCVLPTHFGHGLIGNCLTPLFGGGKLILATDGGIGTAAKLGETVDEHAITFMSSVPSFWKIALKMSPPPARQTIRQVNIGSAPVAADLIGSVITWSGTHDVRNMYGITETANWVAGNSAAERPPEDGLVGTMWEGEAAVRGSDGVVRPSGSGELLLRSEGMMTGYLHRPDLTSEVMDDDWYHTGDLGTIDDAGVVRLTGRQKYEINRAGMKISPEEIDLLLEQHGAVSEACTFSLPDDVAGEIVAAAISRNQGSNLTAPDLRQWMAARIRRECIPERWFFLDAIPKTDRGKLNRDRVREACLNNPEE